MFDIEIDGKFLTQWDTDRWILIHPEIAQLQPFEVHVANKSNPQALVVNVEKGERGCYHAPIPNILLQSGDVIKVWVMVESENGRRNAVCERVFPVAKRPKPQDYVYTETEVKTYDEIMATLDSYDSILALEALVEADVVTPVANNNNALFVNNDGAIYVL